MSGQLGQKPLDGPFRHVQRLLRPGHIPLEHGSQIVRLLVHDRDHHPEGLLLIVENGEEHGGDEVHALAVAHLGVVDGVGVEEAAEGGLASGFDGEAGHFSEVEEAIDVVFGDGGDAAGCGVVGGAAIAAVGGGSAAIAAMAVAVFVDGAEIVVFRRRRMLIAKQGMLGKRPPDVLVQSAHPIGRFSRTAMPPRRSRRIRRRGVQIRPPVGVAIVARRLLDQVEVLSLPLVHGDVGARVLQPGLASHGVRDVLPGDVPRGGVVGVARDVGEAAAAVPLHFLFGAGGEAVVIVVGGGIGGGGVDGVAVAVDGAGRADVGDAGGAGVVAGGGDAVEDGVGGAFEVVDVAVAVQEVVDAVAVVDEVEHHDGGGIEGVFLIHVLFFSRFDRCCRCFSVGCSFCRECFFFFWNNYLCRHFLMRRSDGALERVGRRISPSLEGVLVAT
mmetsp:Transcript_7652/g.14447  ORF Transcript_7652/g.14447 Transcript_7652/m.14447 type:complete len:442 (+) Transcript_7652:531-1856(+)